MLYADRFRFHGTTRVIITYWGLLARSFYLGKGRGRRHRKVQENLPARATAHLEMAFQWNEPLQLEVELPERGGRVSTTLQLASLPAMVGLKGLALGERYKEKDAYDLYALARYYGSGIQEVIALLKPHVQDAFQTMNSVLKGCGF